MFKMFIGIVLAFGVSGSALAKSAKDATRDRLIVKFKKVFLQLAPSDPSRTPIALRLADLLAERARLQAMAELDGDCGTCDAGLKDRTEAIKYYKIGLKEVPERQKGKILSQMGHLYELLGESQKAERLYKDVLARKVGGAAEAEALISLAEMSFKSGDFERAIVFYTKAADHPDLKKKGFAHYRRAWSYFNSGQVAQGVQGLTRMLKTPKLLSRTGDSGAIENEQFKAEVARDLATFMAREAVTLEEAKMLYELSPEKSRLENVSYLASELERLGQLRSSVKLWKFVQKLEKDPLKRFDGRIHLAQIHWNLREKPLSKENYLMALDLWQSIGGCNEDQCRERKSRLRAFVLAWHKSEKEPSEDLVELYQRYLDAFDDDAVLWVNLARIFQQTEKSQASYRIFMKVLAKYQKLPADTKKVLPAYEKLLTTLVSVAEVSSDRALIDKSYKYYLTHSKARNQEMEIRYQQAYLLYKDEKYDQAAEGFYALTKAARKGAGAKLKVQAADLALDSLAILKDDVRLGQWSEEFAGMFPAKAKGYRKLVRTSIMNQVAKDVESGGLQAAWLKLGKVEVKSLSEGEKKLYFRNKFLLAEKLGKYTEARLAVKDYLKIKNLTPKERNEALVKKAWYAELKLDFKEALSVAKTLPHKNLSAEQKWLKLALFAELAGEKYDGYYRSFLKAKHSSDKARIVLEKWVRESKEPLKTIFSLQGYLKKYPKLYSGLMLEEYLKNPTKRLKKLFQRDAVLKTSAAAKVVWGQEYFKKYSKIQGEIASMTIDSSNQRKLAKGIKTRVYRLNRLEKMLKTAVQRDHWGAQVVTIDLLATENDRFYQELLSLPMPDGLTPEEQQQYLQILSQQAAPHQNRAMEFKSKRDEMLADPNVVSGYLTDIAAASMPVKGAIAEELRYVGPLLTEEGRVQITAKMNEVETTPAVPSLVEVEAARTAVRQEPLNLSALDELLQVEKELGRKSMVSYLKGRKVILQEYRSGQAQTKETANE